MSFRDFACPCPIPMRKEHSDCDKSCGKKNALCNLLKNSLPTDDIAGNIVVNGAEIGVTGFINVNCEAGLAYFRDGADTKVVDCNKLDMITIEG